MSKSLLRKLGKRAPQQDASTPLFQAYLTKDLPTPLSSVSWTSKVTKWPMMANDNLGDCTIAAVGHQVECWTANASSSVIIPDADIIKAYSAVSGYDPVTGANDDGAVETEVLQYWRNTGVGGHKILVWAALEPKNHDHLKLSVQLFGGAYIGIALPLIAEDQINAHKPWTASFFHWGRSAPGSWGGHAVNIVAYDKTYLTCVTWGGLQKMSWSFWDAYVDEAYVVLSHDWMNSKDISPSGLNLTALQKDLDSL